jgi:hypothetical protein
LASRTPAKGSAKGRSEEVSLLVHFVTVIVYGIMVRAEKKRITLERAIKLREARRLSQARQEQVRLEREKARLRIQ